MDAIPENSDLMTVFDKDDVKKCMAWLLWEASSQRWKKGDSWFRNFTELVFLIAFEIIGENADDYIYTWGSVINSLDKPTPIKIRSNRAGFKSVSDVVI